MAEQTVPTPERLRALPTWQLTQAHARAHTLLQQGLVRAGARGHHYRLLSALEESGPLSQAQVGRAVALDRSDVAGGLAELEARGLVRRDADPRDRRRNQVALTPAGAQFLRELDVVMHDVQEAFLARLSASERVVLAELLGRLAEGPL